ncbi:SMI1/KNR4 family protein [Streptomyces sp. NPDC051907]|uniref:SMI1/KNR4 family protein n=1 Tax=Streptomyces sp. NPDC051907 TaxID=3155284 RepID=UPI003428864F
MTLSDDRVFPPALAAVAGIGFHYDDDGVDFEPYDRFLTAEETADWLRAWTGNDELDGGDLRVFGQDGTGGYAAFWLVRTGAPLECQPVVFFGSEGELGVVAGDLPGFLWLLADGFGPLEAVEYPDGSPNPNPRLAAVAERFTSGERRSAKDVMAEAAREFPDFERTIVALCR